MKKIFFFCCLVLLTIGMPLNSFAEKPIHIDVLFMNHGPLQPTLRELRTLFPAYGDRITVSWHEFESPEGEQFMAKRGIKEHTPLEIWLDGQSTVRTGDKTITFKGFPTGSGPSFFQGKWKVEDLQTVLDQETGIE
jgi:hypothetical protein